MQVPEATKKAIKWIDFLALVLMWIFLVSLAAKSIKYIQY